MILNLVWKIRANERSETLLVKSMTWWIMKEEGKKEFYEIKKGKENLAK